MGTQYIGIKRLVDIGITNPKWYLGINFLLLGSILLPGEIKSIIAVSYTHLLIHVRYMLEEVCIDFFITQSNVWCVVISEFSDL